MRECVYCGRSEESTAHKLGLPNAHEFDGGSPEPTVPTLGQVLDEQVASLSARLDVIEARLRVEGY